MTAKNVDDYIAGYKGLTRQRLEQMRATILKTAPDAVESISYGMPAYKQNNKPLVYFAGFAKHIGLYATPNGHEKFKKQFAPYKQGKGSVQLPHDQPLPLELVASVVRFRLGHLD